MGLISLTTDFGSRDEYVGVMKAVIWGLAPRQQIVDISHQVAPQDRHQAAFLVAAAYPYFETGSVHVVVVDPGVGSQRRIVAMAFEGHYFILPDNGICSLILKGARPEALVSVRESAFFRPQVSRTFHGRDIFAPVAAHLASGRPLSEFGPALAVEMLHQLAPPAVPYLEDGQLVGTIVQVDHFGNLTTNIDRQHLDLLSVPFKAQQRSLNIRLGENLIQGLSACYADVSRGSPLALIGSRGYLEIAVNQGDAGRHFGVSRGDRVWLEA